jgi:hypothetical protein
VKRATARLQMSVSRSALELTEVRCSCRPGTQGAQSCNYGRRSGLLKANGEDVRQPWVSEKHGMVPLKPTRAASHRDAPRTTGRPALQRRCGLEAAKGQQTKSKDGGNYN